MKADGSFSEKEKEWVSTATKYISSKHLPILGRVLKIVDDVSLLVGRVLFIAIIAGALAILGIKVFK